MNKAQEILEKYPSIKIGLDDHYGKQTALNAINEALTTDNWIKVSEQNLRELMNSFYQWLDGLSEAEYDGMSLTDKCEKFFFSQPLPNAPKN